MMCKSLFAICQKRFTIRFGTKEVSYDTAKPSNVHFFYYDNIQQAIIESCPWKSKSPLTTKDRRIDNSDLERATLHRSFRL